jgi:hypothetical protein
MSNQQRKLVEIRKRIAKLNILIQRYRQIKNTLDNSFYTVTRIDTNKYSRPKNYKILLQRYVNRVKGRRTRNNNNNNENNNNNNDNLYVRGRRYR